MGGGTIGAKAAGMGYAPRFIPQGAFVEVTRRIEFGRMLLMARPELNARIEGIIGRAQHLAPVAIYDYQFMSNHLHMLLGVDDANQLEKFLKHLFRNIALAVRELTEHRGRVWSGRTTVTVILDARAAMQRHEYHLSNGVKEGLVATPLDWPGVSSSRALLEQHDIRVSWTDSAQRREARRRGVPIGSQGLCHEYTIRLVPMPSLESRTRSERMACLPRSRRAAPLPATAPRPSAPIA
jgi:hypothetical protein